MGVLKFLLPSKDLARRLPGFRRAYFTGLDRTPGKLSIDFRNGLMVCHRDSGESGRFFVPWPVSGFGTVMVGTATLAERPEPYILALELARGKLNDVSNQLAYWTQEGLRIPADLNSVIAEARQAFIRSALSTDTPEECCEAAQRSLEASCRVADLLTQAYVSQALENRLAATGKLTTSLGCVLSDDPQRVPGSGRWTSAFNSCQIAVSWRQIVPSEGKYRWELLDAQLAWCRRHQLNAEVGPLVEFRPAALPDWIWLWEGDPDSIGGLIHDFVRQTVLRYRGKVPVWHIVHRPASHDILGLSEEDQIRITARAIQAARQADPFAQLSLGVDRPWGEWMSGGRFQLGPLHFCDYLLRSDLGLSSIGLEIAPGYTNPGSHLRDLFEFSKLLDLFSLLQVPLHLFLVFPSAAGPDPLADPTVQVDTWQWPVVPDEALQSNLVARWLALALAKRNVHSVTYLQSSDSLPHLYPHGGLYRADGTPKPVVGWLERLRQDILA